MFMLSLLSVFKNPKSPVTPRGFCIAEMMILLYVAYKALTRAAIMAAILIWL